MTEPVLQVNIVTIFPEYFESPLGVSLLGKAIATGVIEVECVDPRDHAGAGRRVDDYAYGGGPGMVMTPGPIFSAVESLANWRNGPVIYLTPSGRPFSQRIASELAGEKALTLICGRYEGIDQRVAENLADIELSVGDYVLAGGEAAALVVIEAVARLVPGVIGNSESTVDESFADLADLRVEYPQYTRPAVFQGWSVPEVLQSGDHGAIAEWRASESRRRTRERRPDLAATPADDQRDP